MTPITRTQTSEFVTQSSDSARIFLIKGPRCFGGVMKYSFCCSEYASSVCTMFLYDQSFQLKLNRSSSSIRCSSPQTTSGGSGRSSSGTRTLLKMMTPRRANQPPKRGWMLTPQIFYGSKIQQGELLTTGTSQETQCNRRVYNGRDSKIWMTWLTDRRYWLWHIWRKRRNVQRNLPFRLQYIAKCQYRTLSCV
jgi:hypothetical protein